MTAVANWYPDPSAKYQLRYWDGITWTGHVSHNGSQFDETQEAVNNIGHDTYQDLLNMPKSQINIFEQNHLIFLEIAVDAGNERVGYPIFDTDGNITGSIIFEKTDPAFFSVPANMKQTAHFFDRDQNHIFSVHLEGSKIKIPNVDILHPNGSLLARFKTKLSVGKTKFLVTANNIDIATLDGSFGGGKAKMKDMQGNLIASLERGVLDIDGDATSGDQLHIESYVQGLSRTLAIAMSTVFDMTVIRTH